MRSRPLRARDVQHTSPLRRWRKKVRVYGAAIAGVALIAASPYVSDLTYHPRVSLGEVSVAGVSHVSPNLVKAVFEYTLHDGTYHYLSPSNIFWYPKQVLTTALQERIPRIKTVSIERDGLLAQAVTITVEERKRFGVWCNGRGQCFEMDKDGFIFAAAPTSAPMREYVFLGFFDENTLPVGKTFIGEYMPNVIAFLDYLEKKGLKPIQVISKDPVDYWVKLENGISVRAAFSNAPEEMARNLELALSSDALRGQVETLEYIDLRFGNKLYYKTL